MATRTPGHKRQIMPATSLMFCKRLCTKYTCPPRETSYAMASRIVSSLNCTISVNTGCLFGGGVFMILKSRAPIKENCSVLGIGVAVSVNVSTVVFKVFSLSFTATPNFCSSSIIIKPKSLNFTFSPINLWVPIKISISPFSTFLSVAVTSFALLKRLIKSTFTGKSAKRLEKLR